MRGNTVTMKLLQGTLNRANLPLYQYDYGQKLILTGVTLPETYEVHFSNSLTGESKASLGNSEGVMIPDEFLTSGENVFVWLFLHDTASDGETEYKGQILVQKRARPVNSPPTPVQQDIIEQVIAALEHVQIDIDTAVQAKDDAVAAAGNAERDAQTASGKAQEAAVSELAAKGYSDDAKDAKDAAVLAKQAAEQAAASIVTATVAETTEIIFCKCLRYLREKSLPPLASVFLALERLARAC